MSSLGFDAVVTKGQAQMKKVMELDTAEE